MRWTHSGTQPRLMHINFCAFPVRDRNHSIETNLGGNLYDEFERSVITLDGSRNHSLRLRLPINVCLLPTWEECNCRGNHSIWKREWRETVCPRKWRPGV